jgi:hypothetical protein
MQPEKMKVVCAWCKKVIEEHDTKIVSHGMCLDCVSDIEEDIENYDSHRKKPISET